MLDRILVWELPVTTVHVYLTDGFKDDHVVVSVDGRKVLDENGVTTQKLYGLAKEVGPVSVDGSNTQLEVRLPEKGLRAAINVDLSKGNHVPVSLQNGSLTHSVTKRIGFA